ncbi:hypothetical protein ABEY96_28870 [Priestia aryabhattai]|uniref:hypothetical protein n=1 Tax=Priestia aryabhattai TaxID=412384 RepID=UPI003D2E87F0
MSNIFNQINSVNEENNKEKTDKIVNKSVNKNVNNKANKKTEEKKQPNRKNSRLVESLLQQKKEERVLVGFRLEKSVSDAIDTIVKENKLKKSDFVNDLLKKAMGLS